MVSPNFPSSGSAMFILDLFLNPIWPIQNKKDASNYSGFWKKLGGSFEHFLFSSLFVQDSNFD